MDHPLSDAIYVPAGAWIRERWLQPAEPEWHGAWHLATGDVRLFIHRNRKALVRCGHRVVASIDYRWDGRALGDVVVADTLPLVDVCTRCLRLSGAPVTIAVQPRRVTVELRDR